MVPWSLLALLLLPSSSLAHSHAEEHGDHFHENSGKFMKIHQNYNLWMSQTLPQWSKALFASTLVGLAPILVLLVIPFDFSNPASLNVVLAFAVGGLIGDVFLHLLPHCIPNNPNWGFWVMTGLLVFFFIDKVVRAYAGDGHVHSHEALKKKNDDVPGKHVHSIPPNPAKIAARYLNLAADFAHNFTDGLAIGSAFTIGNQGHSHSHHNHDHSEAKHLSQMGVGLATTLAILIHEVPHEIGDYAILIQTGLSRVMAMRMQLWTAIGALAGTVVGILVENAQEEASWILPFTAGGFLYISCVSVMPQLLKESENTHSANFKEIGAIVIGIFFMALITFIE